MRDEPTIRFLSLGGGLQSSTIAEMIAEGELAPVDVAIFADTGDEPAHVYEQINYLKGRLNEVGIALEVVSAGNLVEDLLNKKGRFASIPVFTKTGNQVGRLRRQCTREYKVEPIERRVREYMLAAGAAKRNKAGQIVIKRSHWAAGLLGITIDEIQRLKDARTPFIKNQWPLVDLRFTRAACMSWLLQKSLPVPQKSSCRICPYHRDLHWRQTKEQRPEDWEHIIKIDEFLRGKNNFTAALNGELFLHRDCIPLAEVVFNPMLPGFDDSFCEEGYCFI